MPETVKSTKQVKDSAFGVKEGLSHSRQLSYISNQTKKQLIIKSPRPHGITMDTLNSQISAKSLTLKLKQADRT
jgi:hypothetical protein